MPRFSPHSSRAQEPHRFEAYDCEPAEANLVEELALAVRHLYIEPESLRERLLEASRDLDEVADLGEIRAAVERIAGVAIPPPGARLAQPQLDTARNELGEVIAYAALEDIYAALIPAKRVREKEVPGLPSRGLDALALADEDGLVLLTAEVKTSDEEASPPRVVGQGESSLHGQLTSLVCDGDRLLVELNWALKHAREEHKEVVARAILMQTRGDLPLAAVPVLVRPMRCHGDGDYGIFEQQPESVAPAAVRFCLVRVDGELDGLADVVYRKAREG